MAHRASLYRVCGPALILGGVLLLAAFALKPVQPATLEAAADLGLDKWVLSNWMFVIGSVVLLGGWIGLTEHLNDTAVEGWSTIGLGGVVIGCVGLAIAGAISAESLPRLLQTYSDANQSLATGAYYTIDIMTNALGWMAWTILWIGTALTGLAIAENNDFPRWLGFSGLAIAAIEIASQLMPETSLLHDAFGMIGCAWLVAVGFIFFRVVPRADVRPETRETVVAGR